MTSLSPDRPDWIDCEMLVTGSGATGLIASGIADKTGLEHLALDPVDTRHEPYPRAVRLVKPRSGSVRLVPGETGGHARGTIGHAMTFGFSAGRGMAATRTASGETI